MGLFDRFTNKKGGKEDASAEKLAETPPPRPEPAVHDPVPQSPPPPAAPAAGEASGGVLQRLRFAREKIDGRDLPAALAIYEEVLVTAGDRADVLVTISGDLGSSGHVRPIIDLIAPRYVAERHGPAPGLNLLQAYLAVRDVEAAQHMLDLLFSLNRQELEERLYGFSNALSDLMLMASTPAEPAAAPLPPDGTAPSTRKVSLVSISKPIWFYGLEPLEAEILPPKEGRLRRVAFAQLALPGAYRDFTQAMSRPEDEVARLARALPAWLAETFCFSSGYGAIVAIACAEASGPARYPLIFGDEWGTETLRQLIDSNQERLDFIFTGTLRQRSGDYEANFRVWEVKRFRERKQFSVRWTPGTADEELSKLRQTLCQYMEWSPYPAGARGLAFAPPAATRVWVDSLGASLGLFLAEKGIWPMPLLPPLEPLAAGLARLAPESEAASLAWITFERRCQALGLTVEARPERLFNSPLVQSAEGLGQTPPGV